MQANFVASFVASHSALSSWPKGFVDGRSTDKVRDWVRDKVRDKGDDGWAGILEMLGWGETGIGMRRRALGVRPIRPTANAKTD